nr:energy transducer TonB [uncultured Flavobacterium sp.]
MRNLIILIFVSFLFQFVFSQTPENNKSLTSDSLHHQITIITDSLHPEKSHIPVIVDAKYKGGINNFYSYVGNNYNFNNLKSSDILDDFKNKDIMIIYIQFDVNEEGKPVNFEAINTSLENTFYKEAIRVIGSTRWTPGTKDGEVFSQKFRIPVQAYIRDFIN